MKTEQTLVGVLFVVCAMLVLTALVALMITPAAPPIVVHGPIQNLPAIIVNG